MKLSLVGMGMGDAKTMTLQAASVFKKANVVLGAPRLLEMLPKQDGTRYLSLSLPAEVAGEIRRHPEWERVCVALSGDVGFYSGAAKLMELLEDLAPELICGISSPQQLAARLRRPWQDFKLVSAHAGDCDVLAEVLNHPAVFFLAGSSLPPAEICRQLAETGLGDAMVTVAENLCAEDERIVSGAAAELAGQQFAALSVLLVENRRSFTRTVGSPGIAGDEFIRGSAPMTKREVRVNILAQLGICPSDMLWDVGAGTGSVAVEMALLARWGRVYAIECDKEACGLIQQNKEKFGAYNLNVMEGMAPDALDALPAPQAVFIGGSRGNLRAIMEKCLQKNPDVRVVASAVTLETLHEAMASMQAFGLENSEVVQISVSRAEKTGSLHMLRAQNPVFLISGGGRA